MYIGKDCENILKIANKNRKTSSTKMNDHSSRSHLDFILTITSTSMIHTNDTDKIVPIQRVSKLHLVDLAGSENQKQSQTTGTAFKEARNINLSLLTLGKVISALVKGGFNYVPFRESKLTKILANSLRGDSATVMIANISPLSTNYFQTLSTLRFANDVKQIKTTMKVVPGTRQTLEELEAKQSKFVKIIQELKEKYKEAERRNDELKEEKNELNKKVDQLMKVNALLKVKDDENEQLNHELKQRDDRIKKLEDQVNMERSEKQQLQSELHTKEKEIQELESKQEMNNESTNIDGESALCGDELFGDDIQNKNDIETDKDDVNIQSLPECKEHSPNNYIVNDNQSCIDNDDMITQLNDDHGADDEKNEQDDGANFCANDGSNDASNDDASDDGGADEKKEEDGSDDGSNDDTSDDGGADNGGDNDDSNGCNDDGADDEKKEEEHDAAAADDEEVATQICVTPEMIHPHDNSHNHNHNHNDHQQQSNNNRLVSNISDNDDNGSGEQDGTDLYTTSPNSNLRKRKRDQRDEMNNRNKRRRIDYRGRAPWMNEYMSEPQDLEEDELLELLDEENVSYLDKHERKIIEKELIKKLLKKPPIGMTKRASKAIIIKTWKKIKHTSDGIVAICKQNKFKKLTHSELMDLIKFVKGKTKYQQTYLLLMQEQRKRRQDVALKLAQKKTDKIRKEYEILIGVSGKPEHIRKQKVEIEKRKDCKDYMAKIGNDKLNVYNLH